MNLDDLIEKLIELRDVQRVDGSTPVRAVRLTRRDGEQVYFIDRIVRDGLVVKLKVTG